MEIGDALKRLGFKYWADVTNYEVIDKAWEARTAKLDPSADYDLTKTSLSDAKATLYDYKAQELVKQQAADLKQRERQEYTFNMLPPMDLERVMTVFALSAGEVLEENEIEAKWLKLHETTAENKGAPDPSKIFREFNQAKRILLELMKLPEQQEALRLKRLDDTRRREEERLAEREEEMRMYDAQRKEENLLVDKEEKLLTNAQHEEERVEQIAKSTVDERNERKRQNRIESENRENDRCKRRKDDEEKYDMEIDDVMHKLAAAAELNRQKAAAPPSRQNTAAEPNHQKASGIEKRMRTNNKKEHCELKKEMSRVFAERFEEKPGDRIKSKDLFEMFLKSTTMTNADKSVFTYHCRDLFFAQWTHSRISKHRNENYFMDVVEKSE
jgi:hypothetical protein